MVTVVLHGAEFFAKHGFYPEEQILGGRFTVNIEVGFIPKGDLNEDELDNTVNYGILYKIACEQMHQTRQLIETVAQGILDDIKNHHPDLEMISVSVKKLNPPLGGEVKHSGVILTYNRAVDGI